MSLPVEELEQVAILDTFIRACKTGNVLTVSKKLEQDPTLVEKSAEDGMTALMLAAQNGQVEVLTTLLEKDANIDAVVEEGPYKGTTALWWAANGKQWDIVSLLVKEGVSALDVSPASGLYQGLTPLWFAAGWQQWGIVELLLTNGAKSLDVSPSAGPHQGLPALWFAAVYKEWGIVELLLTNGAKNLDASPARGSYQGKTALWYMVVEHNDKLFRSLLAKGAALELPGNIFVNLESINKALGESEVLDHNQIKITFKNVKLLFALAKKDKLNEEEIQALKKALYDLKRGSALNGRINGETALHIAIGNKNQSVIKALISAGADLYLTNKEGQTAESLLAGLPLAQSFVNLQSLRKELAECLPIDSIEKFEIKKQAEQAVQKKKIKSSKKGDKVGAAAPVTFTFTLIQKKKGSVWKKKNKKKLCY